MADLYQGRSKNRVSLPFKLDDTVTAIINEYVHDFRSALVRGSNADWLFPGDGNNHKKRSRHTQS